MDDDWITIENEFTSVRVRKRLTRNGERLEIAAAGGTSIELDALILEGLTWLEPRELSEPLKEPHGPEPETQILPLSRLFGAT